MTGLTDQQLLRDYSERQTDAAFAELVRRHVDLVYSATLRMVCDAHLAQDVTQAVFIALAQNALSLTARPVLSGWLHRTAQNLAAKTVRTDVRRRAREQEAATMNELLATESDTPWEHIAPHLDAALGELSEPDRDAVLLRYFENKSLREVGQVLGTSDDTAQKRVSRAVERLREFFAKRGVTVGASGLVVVISANAVQAAPVGLAVTISTAAALGGTTIAATTTATAIKTIAMTTLQKTIIGAALAVAIGTGVYVATRPSHPRTEGQGTYLRADIDKDIPLALAIEQANAKFPNVQPLTEDEVIAAVRAIKLEHREIPDPIYEIYQRVVTERVLPRGMYFSHIPGWGPTAYGDFEVDWKDLTLDWDRAGIKDGKPGTSFNYRIRARFISLVGDKISATTLASPRPEELHKPGYLGIRADIDKDIPLAQAIELANAKYGDVQPLTEAEVVAAVRAIKLKWPDISDSTYEIYQRVVTERVLPRGMYFSHIPGWNTDNGNFEVDWKDLTFDSHRAGIKGGEPGGSFNYRIRARFISSRPLTSMDRQAMRLNQERQAARQMKASQSAPKTN